MLKFCLVSRIVVCSVRKHASRTHMEFYTLFYISPSHHLKKQVFGTLMQHCVRLKTHGIVEKGLLKYYLALEAITMYLLLQKKLSIGACVMADDGNAKLFI